MKSGSNQLVAISPKWEHVAKIKSLFVLNINNFLSNPNEPAFYLVLLLPPSAYGSSLIGSWFHFADSMLIEIPTNRYWLQLERPCANLVGSFTTQLMDGSQSTIFRRLRICRGSEETEKESSEAEERWADFGNTGTGEVLSAGDIFDSVGRFLKRAKRAETESFLGRTEF